MPRKPGSNRGHSRGRRRYRKARSQNGRQSMQPRIKNRRAFDGESKARRHGWGQLAGIGDVRIVQEAG